MADADPTAAGGDASVRGGYVAHGARGYYERFGADYRNPHEPVIADLIARCANDWPLDVSHVLDLAAGSGEVTIALMSFVGATPASPVESLSTLAGEAGLASTKVGRIDAIDPYTAEAYEKRTGRPCERMSFEAIAAGRLTGRRYSLVVCSFALHLAEPSRLPGLLWELASVADQLMVLTPHKKPEIDPAWGWTLTHERLFRRVRARLYVVQPGVKGLS